MRVMMHLPKDAPKLLEGAQEALLKGKLRIKLSRRPFARTHTPIFSINVQESWRRRDGRPIEYLGKYWAKPLPEDGRKRLELNFERCKYWLGKGAQPTDRVLWLLEKAGIVPTFPIKSEGSALQQAANISTSTPETATAVDTLDCQQQTLSDVTPQSSDSKETAR